MRLIVAMWTIAAAFAAPYLVYQRKYAVRDDISICHWQRGINSRTRTLFKFAECIILYMLPLALLSIVYTIMSYVLWGVGGADTLLHVNNEQQMVAILKLRRSVVKMLIISMLLYFVCYSPIQGMITFNLHFIVVGLFIAEMIRSQPVHITQWLRLTLHALAVASSAVNPIVYTLCCRHFRNRFVQLMTWTFGCCLQQSLSTHDTIRRRIRWSTSPYVSFRRSFRRRHAPRRQTITAV